MKVLVLDVEIAPALATVWQLFKVNISLNQLLETSYLLCWAARWKGESEVQTGSLYVDGKDKMLKRIHALINEADVIISFNGDDFDLKVLMKEFLLAGFKPPAPWKSVDILKTFRKRFRFVSNKMDHLCQQLGIGKKMEHEGHELWLKCMRNEEDAWKRMIAYNKKDVVLLDKLHDRAIAWISKPANHNLYRGDDVSVCPNCGNGRLQRRGWSISSVGKYPRFQCVGEKGCGAWSRGAVSPLTKEKRAAILRPAA